MTGSRVALAVLVAIAIALAAIVITDSPRAPVVVDHALLPGVDADTITELAWTLSDGAHVTLTRPAPKQPWTFKVGSVRARARVDGARVDAALAALRGGRWQRTLGRRPPSVAPTTQLVVTAGGRSISLGIAPAGTGQTWIVRDGEALLVDDWLARALAPTRLELNQRRPLADIESAIAFSITTYEPPVEFQIERGALFVRDQEVFRVEVELELELERAFAALEIVALPTAPSTGEPILSVHVTLTEPIHVTVQSACTGTTCPCPAATYLVLSDTGDGCVAQDQIDELMRLVKRFQAPATELADPRVVSLDPESYSWDVGGDDRLTFSKQPMVARRGWSGPAAIERAVAIAAAMQFPGRVVPFSPPGNGIGRRQVTDANAGNETFFLFPGNLIYRPGEPVAIQLPDQAYAALQWTPDQVRDGRLWIEEPTTIQTITLRELEVEPGRTLRTRTLTRGAVVGEWLVDGKPLTAPQGTVLDAFAAMLAAPRAVEVIVRPKTFRHQVLVEVNPFPGSGSDPVVHTMSLAAPTAAGCPIASDAMVGMLMDRELCSAVATLLK